MSSLLRPDASRNPLLFSDFAVDVRQMELQRVEAELITERTWLAGRKVLLIPDKPSIISAVQSGEIEQVLYNQPHYSPTYDFYDRQTPEQLQALQDNAGGSTFSVPYLRPVAHDALRRICTAAHDITIENGELPDAVLDFKYSVPSMTRSVNYQRAIRARGVLAADPDDGFMSTHAYGLAFDIDHSGIYTRTTGGWQAVGLGRQEHLYLPGAINNLADVLEKLQNSDVLHAICEVPNGRGAYHVAVNPEALTI